MPEQLSRMQFAKMSGILVEFKVFKGVNDRNGDKKDSALYVTEVDRTTAANDSSNVLSSDTNVKTSRLVEAGGESSACLLLPTPIVPLRVSKIFLAKELQRDRQARTYHHCSKENERG